jgi:hypothetical protein
MNVYLYNEGQECKTGPVREWGRGDGDGNGE